MKLDLRSASVNSNQWNASEEAALSCADHCATASHELGELTLKVMSVAKESDHERNAQTSTQAKPKYSHLRGIP
jgi:hypothetical protein